MAAVTLPQLEAAGPAAFLDALLEEREAAYYLRLQRRPLRRVYERLEAHAPAGGQFLGGPPELARALLVVLQELRDASGVLEAHVRAQETLIRDVDDGQAYQMLVLETARVLGAGHLALRADAQALGRDLDWEGIRQRARRRVNSLARTLQAALIVLRNLIEHLREDPADRLSLIEELMLAALELLDEPLHPLLAREAVRFSAAIVGLEGARQALPCRRVEEQLLVRARDPRRDVWVQCYALEGLAATSAEAARAIVERRLTPAEERFPDTLFVRRYVLDRLDRFLGHDERAALLQRMLEAPDPSPHVRQGVLLAICALPVMQRFALLEEQIDQLEREEVPQVRAALPVGLAPLTVQTGDFDLWDRYFALESDPTSLQIGIALLSERLDVLLFETPALNARAETTALRALARSRRDDWPLPIKRQVEELLERVRVAALPSFVSFKRALLSAAGDLLPGDWFDLIDVDGDRPEQDELGRLMAWFAQGREGLYAFPREHGYRVTYSFTYVLRAWRLLHETLHPAPDKRPAHSHVRGRHHAGTVRAHSTILAEQSPTKVPGEPIVITSEGGWRSFLPLVDDFLDALKLGQLRNYSPQGVTTITPPHAFKQRWKVWWRLTRDYLKLAGLREQCRLDNPEVAPSEFVDTLRGLGFDVHFRPFPPAELCTAIRYFSEVEEEEDAPEPAIVTELLGSPVADLGESTLPLELVPLEPATDETLPAELAEAQPPGEATQPIEVAEAHPSGEATQPIEVVEAPAPDPSGLTFLDEAPDPADLPAPEAEAERAPLRTTEHDPDAESEPAPARAPTSLDPSSEGSSFILVVKGETPDADDDDSTQALFPGRDAPREGLGSATWGKPVSEDATQALFPGRGEAPREGLSQLGSAKWKAGDATVPIGPRSADAPDDDATQALFPGKGDGPRKGLADLGSAKWGTPVDPESTQALFPGSDDTRTGLSALGSAKWRAGDATVPIGPRSNPDDEGTQPIARRSEPPPDDEGQPEPPPPLDADATQPIGRRVEFGASEPPAPAEPPDPPEDPDDADGERGAP